MPTLSPFQQQIVDFDFNSKLFVSGPGGAGKTTVGIERMRSLLAQGAPGESILLLTPQRTLQEPYFDLLYSPERRAGGEATPATFGGLARRMCDLFWPLAGEAAGFARPDQPPVFLTLETAQYYMTHLVRPLLDAGYFESVTIDRNRLYSQIIDNLNKAAMIGFPHTEIGSKLDLSYFGDPAQRRVYADAQECANRFRQYCLAHNLLDFSLQLEIFTNILWREPIVKDYLVKSYRHLIYDNVEEDGPRAHDILREWLPSFDSVLLIYDEGAGFRYFLGADTQTGWGLRELCNEHIQLQESFVMSEAVAGLSERLVEAIIPNQISDVESQSSSDALFILRRIGSESDTPRFYPELLDSVVNEINSLISNSLISPSEIVILAPYLSDALRFSLTHRLEAKNIPWRSHRPSRSLKDEPASQTMITLAALAHPHWNIHPPKFDAAYALMQSIDGLDLVRAQLLTDIVYRQRDLQLSTFDQIKPDVQERITFSVGNRYSTLRNWIEEYRASDVLPLDHFLRKLFGEVLSQTGFGYHRNFDSIRVAASLVESAKKFRVALESDLRGLQDLEGLGREYIQMLQDGVIAASYLEGWQNEDKDAVLIAPAHTFLMMNRPVTIQFWLDPGSSGWYERLAQPLTHPYVLSRGWQAGRQWTDADDVQYSKEALARLVSGLLHRCRERVYLGISELGESGFEGRGELLRAFQKIL
ncbi:MAG: hypothetical protein OZ914_11845 [Anaerolineaceae bacterium]|jgi:hypothetical protein|nr:hypothetical protein [Anaerolineaceae bacterium]OQY88680.1 MAG: hypothetical protein B6D38_09950 [Anaerolineae bacterium UTCFX1]